MADLSMTGVKPISMAMREASSGVKAVGQVDPAQLALDVWLTSSLIQWRDHIDAAHHRLELVYHTR
jgi:hypothetical protein